MAPHPELLIPSFFALFCCIYPAPWHVRNRNIATLGMIFWMSALNISHIINCIVWSDNADIKASVWGDITVAINIGYNYGLPLSHFILAKQLENSTSLRSDSPLYSVDAQKRHRIFDLCLAFLGPPTGFLISLSARQGRFVIVESFGPLPMVYWDTWGVVWIAVVPISIAMLCLVYTFKACYNIIRRRQQMLSIISKNAGLDKSHFWRLLILAIAELGTCMIRAVFNMMSGTHGLDTLRFDNEVKSISRINTLMLADIDARQMMIYRLSWFTVVACSFVFFLCFATSTETKRFYWNLLRRVFPCIPDRQDAEDRKIRLNSQNSSAGTGMTSDPATSQSHDYPITPAKEYSMMDMLASPVPEIEKHNNRNSKVEHMV